MEPWGLVVNEAAACGLPLLVSDRAGCVETLVPDRTGTDRAGGSTRDDVEAMAAALRLDGRLCPRPSAGRWAERAAEVVARLGPGAVRQRDDRGAGARRSAGAADRVGRARRTVP